MGDYMRYLLLAAAIVAAAPATAAEFTGPRIEARVGYDRLGLKLSDGEDSIKGHKDGVAFGAGVGYDFALGKGLIAGVEANLDFFSTKTCTEIFGEDEACLKARRDIEVSARLGGKVSDKVLIYGKVGYANGQVKLTYNDFEDILEDFSAKADKGGIRVGAGLELALGEKAYAKVEYRYTDYSGDSVEGIKLNFDRNQVIGAIGVRF